jgi:hypothetical protein
VINKTKQNKTNSWSVEHIFGTFLCRKIACFLPQETTPDSLLEKFVGNSLQNCEFSNRFTTLKIRKKVRILLFFCNLKSLLLNLKYPPLFPWEKSDIFPDTAQLKIFGGKYENLTRFSTEQIE